MTRSFYFLERVHRAFFVCGERYLLLQFFPHKKDSNKKTTHAEEKNKLTKAHLQKNLFSPHAYPRQEKILLSYHDDDDDDDDVEHAALHSLGKGP